MVCIRAFKGFRPRPELAAKIASFPYDVINSEEARELAAGNPYSFLHVVKPEIDLDPSISIYDEKVYAKGKENLDSLIRKGHLFQDPDPCLYIYRLKMGQHVQTGLVVCCSIDDYEKDLIKKHEQTRQEKEQDRMKHIDTLNAHTGPVFLTYRQRDEIDALVKKIMDVQKPEYDFTTSDGITHTFYVISQRDDIERLVDGFAQVPCLYIADGHHRCASAVKVGLKRRQENPNFTGEEEFNSFLAVLFPANQLYIMDYNRVVKDLGVYDEKQFLAELSKRFVVTEFEGTGSSKSFKPDKKHTFGMYLAKKWYRLEAKKKIIDDSDPLKSLDVSILQDNVLAPLLGIKDPRKDKRIDFVGGIRGMKELERLVDTKGYRVAFSLYPTSIHEVMKIADQGKFMPPKSTWFEPKLRSGLIVHVL